MLRALPHYFAMSFRYSQGAFLFTSFLSLQQTTADMVRQMPLVSAGGKSANGQE